MDKLGVNSICFSIDYHWLLPRNGVYLDPECAKIDDSISLCSVGSSLFLNKLEVQAELRCSHAEEGNLATPKIDQFSQEKDHFLLR